MKPVPRDVAEKIRTWTHEPWTFYRQAFGFTPDRWQDKVLHALPTERKMALAACKGPGKTNIEAAAGWWFALTRENAQVYCTSITGDNLRDNLWKELGILYQRCPLLQRLFDFRGERILEKRHPDTWYMAARRWPRDADPSQQASALAGIHGEHVLMILDEVGDYPDGVVVTAEAALSTGGDTRILVAGNLTDEQGPMGRILENERDLWFIVEITGDPDDPDRSPRIDIEWAREQIKKFGRDSAFVRVNILGKFPLGGADNLIGLDVATEASKRNLLPAQYIYSTRVIGVDCARQGDDASVIQLRQGRVAFIPQVFRETKIPELAGLVVRAVADWSKTAPIHGLCIDMDGLGAGVGDILSEQGYTVTPVHSGSRALDPRQYLNRRVEMWHEMAEWMQTGCIYEDAELIKELVSVRRKRPNQHGQIRLETKEEMKERGLASPNKADALAYTFGGTFTSDARAVPEEDSPEKRARFGQHRRGKAITDTWDPWEGAQ